MEDIQLVIEIKGGMIQSIYSVDLEHSIRVKILDYDGKEQGDTKINNYELDGCLSFKELEKLEKKFKKD